MDLIVLGGGISGLAFAHRMLSRTFGKPVRSLLLIEGSARLGGWLDTRHNDGPLCSLFETGPRTMRPAGIAGLETLRLIGELSLGDELLCVSKASESARNRYVWFRGHLHKLPNSLAGILAHSFQRDSPAAGLLHAAVREPFVPLRPADSDDESVYDFFTRRFGKSIADNLATAMVHGIYSGNARELSIRSCFPGLWQAEQRSSSVILGMLVGNQDEHSAIHVRRQKLQKDFPGVYAKAADTSMYSFRQGISTLSDALAQNLAKDARFSVILGDQCNKIAFDADSVKVHVASGKVLTASRIISALPAQQLAKAMSPSQTSFGANIQSASVAVVNIAYAGHGILPVRGFGCLLPATEPGAAIGIIFDSDAIPGQDAVPQTRLTVMIGAERFHNATGIKFEDAKASRFEDIALEVIRTQLGITQEPAVVHVHKHFNCIPQYHVGHWRSLREARETILGSPSLQNRLSVIGSGWQGVSVNDCIYHGRSLADRISLEGNSAQLTTGLE